MDLRAGVVVRLDLVTGEQVVRGSYVHAAERGKAIDEFGLRAINFTPLPIVVSNSTRGRTDDDQ